MIDHYLLILKLKKLYFTDPLITWLDSFLPKDYSLLNIKIVIPILFLSFHGSLMAQDDDVSPFLFNSFIDDIVLALNYSDILLFAEDTKIFH